MCEYFFGWNTAHYLRILYHYHLKLIVWIGQQAPSPGQVVLLLATGDHTDL